MKPALSQEQEKFLTDAVKFLESPSIIMKLSDMVGKPLELAQKALPEKAQLALQSAVNKSLHKALEVAIRSIPKTGVKDHDWLKIQEKVQIKNYLHIAATSTTGAIGGFFGLAGLAVELPISTTIMIRSITDIASNYGVDLDKMENRLECLYVFSLGTKGKFDDAMESSYLSSRIAFANSIRVAAEFLVIHSAKEVLNAIEKGSAPALLQFLSRIAAYFKIAVTEKMLAEAVPVIGAVGGAAINAAFTDFFNNAAKFHFGIKRLEAEFGQEFIKGEYQKVLSKIKAK